jgi:hypothetical protein
VTRPGLVTRVLGDLAFVLEALEAISAVMVTVKIISSFIAVPLHVDKHDKHRLGELSPFPARNVIRQRHPRKRGATPLNRSAIPSFLVGYCALGGAVRASGGSVMRMRTWPRQPQSWGLFVC